MEFNIGSSKLFGSVDDVEKRNAGVNFWGKNLFRFDGGVEDKANLLKGCSNFVEILTGKKIPVRYAQNADSSFTDGKSITISSEIIPENMDSTIGLSLHEGAHCAITDFQLLKDFVAKKNVPVQYHKDIRFIKNLWNWVEDRRIDNWAYNVAPGYEKYYDALYDRYFFTDKITIALVTMHEALKKETKRNYEFFIINSMHPCVSMTELKGLPAIKNIIDLDNVSRLRTSKDCLRVAYCLYDEIMKHVEPDSDLPDVGDIPNVPMDKGEPGDGGNNGNSGEDGQDGKGGQNGYSDSDEGDKDAESDSDGDNEGDNDGDDFDPLGKPYDILIQDDDADIIDIILEDQRKFINGELEKKPISDADNKALQVLLKPNHIEDDVKGQIRVVCVTEIGEQEINAGIYQIFSPKVISKQANWISEGLKLGKMLGSRLKLRAEEKILKTVNQKSGFINKRALFSASFDNDRLFYTVKEESYKDISVHISVDMSGSMAFGTKWENTLISLVALMKATSMIKGIRTQVSMRYSGSLVGGFEEAVSICFYDSAEDNIRKVNLLLHARPLGGTPEGLVYKGMAETMLLPLLKNDTLFINFSDGEPGTLRMSAAEGVKITKEVIKKFRTMGISILSYFISEDSKPHPSTVAKFKTMYGAEAQFIDVKHMMSLVKTINAKFLKMGQNG